MLKKLALGLFIVYPLNEYAQVVDTVRSAGVITRYVQKINVDTVWNHFIEEADLILKIEIKNKYYMTWYGSFSFDVLEIVKGEYKQSDGNFELGLVDFCSERFEKKYRAIMDSNVVYVGFNKITELNLTGYKMLDKVTGTEWDFFMSKVVYPEKG